MDDLKGTTARATPDSRYTEDYGTGSVTYKAHGRRGSRAGESEESILPMQKGIIRTTEVEIR
jgi:hypothetical protein